MFKGMLLDSRKKIEQLDKGRMLASIELLANQCEEAWQRAREIRIPLGYKRVRNIVVQGMGASSLAGHILQSLYADQLEIPLALVNDYQLPRYVTKDTLCIFSSYSGDTEEVLHSLQEAQKRKAKILGLTSGGGLGLFLTKNRLPAYIFQPQFNPCGQPRMGLGYSIFGLLALLKQCGLLNITDLAVQAVVHGLKEWNKIFGIAMELNNNPAKKMAQSLYGKIPVLVASEFLVGNAHTLANQLNENGKTFAAYFSLPELNHHLMEGLTHPETSHRFLSFVLFNSHLYYVRTQKRYQITGEVIRKHRIAFQAYCPRAKTRLLQAFEVLSLGSYLSFYLAMLNQLNPSPVPWVDYLKRRSAA